MTLDSLAIEHGRASNPGANPQQNPKYSYGGGLLIDGANVVLKNVLKQDNIAKGRDVTPNTGAYGGMAWGGAMCVWR